MNIQSYMLAKSVSLQDLEGLVNMKIIYGGWQPLGNITFVPTLSDNTGKLYVQAMVKYDTPSTVPV
jgi:hypothetical protein